MIHRPAPLKRVEIAAVGTYAKELVEMDRAAGSTLEQNGIELSDTLSGEVSKPPKPYYRYPRYPGVTAPER